MNILLIPPKDWLHHPFKNRLNFIFENISKNNNVYILGYNFKRFSKNPVIDTNCSVIQSDKISLDDLSAYYILNAPFHYKSMRRIIDEKDIDVIVSANILPSFLANFLNKPIVYDYLDHFNESAGVYYSKSSVMYNIVSSTTMPFIKYNLKNSTSIITVTNELKNYLKALTNKPIYVIPNGVDFDIIKPTTNTKPHDVPILGYVGSIEHWVDLETPVSALNELDVHLQIVGPKLFSNYFEKIQHMSKKLGVDDKISYTGPIAYEKLSPIISNFDIGLNTLKKMDKNNYSAGGKVFMYSACNIPTISSRVESLYNLIGNMIYYYDDVNDFIDKVNYILKYNNKDHHYRECISRFDWKKLAKEYERVIINSI